MFLFLSRILASVFIFLAMQMLTAQIAGIDPEKLMKTETTKNEELAAYVHTAFVFFLIFHFVCCYIR